MSFLILNVLQQNNLYNTQYLIKQSLCYFFTVLNILWITWIQRYFFHLCFALFLFLFLYKISCFTNCYRLLWLQIFLFQYSHFFLTNFTTIVNRFSDTIIYEIISIDLNVYYWLTTFSSFLLFSFFFFSSLFFFSCFLFFS